MNIDLNEIRRRAGLREVSEFENQTVLGPDSKEGEDALDAEEARCDALYAMYKQEEKKLMSGMNQLGFDADVIRTDVTLNEGTNPTVVYTISITYGELTGAQIQKGFEMGLWSGESKFESSGHTLNITTEFPARETIFAQFV